MFYNHLAILYFSSLGFVVALALLAFSNEFRKLFLTVFSLPAPANQSVIKPFDSIRGFAALWVALFHCWQWLYPFNDAGTHFMIEQGFLAVPLFVSISAFLIYRTLRPVASAHDLANYLKRRWLRIYPLYFIVALVIFIGGYAAEPFNVKDILSEIFMRRLFGYPNYYNPPCWSLYVEEGFYILAPVWFLIFSKRPILGSVLSYVASSFAMVFWPSRELDLLRYFSIGIFLTEVIDFKTREWVPWVIFLVGLGLGFTAICAYIPHEPYAWVLDLDPEYRLFIGECLPISVLCLLWSSVSITLINRVLSWYPFRLLGIVSYSMYMWHSLFVATGTPIIFNGTGSINGSLGVSSVFHAPFFFYVLYGTALIFLSALSYALIERPFLLMRRKAIGVNPYHWTQTASEVGCSASNFN
ncbi:MAG: acyltransferase [Elusimicrobia bacterium]|nr:acyltransferase [Elusimicrobiota bacterium]